MTRWVVIGKTNNYIIFSEDEFETEYRLHNCNLRDTVLVLIRNAIENGKPIRLYTKHDLIEVAPQLRGKLPTKTYEVFETGGQYI